MRGANDFSTTIVADWRAHGLRMVSEERIADDEAELPAQVARATVVGAEAIWVPFYAAGQVARLTRLPVLTSRLRRAPRVGELLGPTEPGTPGPRLISAGNFVADPADPANPAHAALAAAFRARYGAEAPLFWGPVAQGYATARLVARALRETNGRGGSALAGALETAPADDGLLDLLGPPFGPTHELFRSPEQIRLGTWQGGELVPLLTSAKFKVQRSKLNLAL